MADRGGQEGTRHPQGGFWAAQQRVPSLRATGGGDSPLDGESSPRTPLPLRVVSEGLGQAINFYDAIYNSYRLSSCIWCCFCVSGCRVLYDGGGAICIHARLPASSLSPPPQKGTQMKMDTAPWKPGGTPRCALALPEEVTPPWSQPPRHGVSHGCHTFGDGGDARSLECLVPSRPPCTSLLTPFPTSPGPLSHLSGPPFSSFCPPQAQPPSWGSPPKGSPVASGVSSHPPGARGAGKRHKASPRPVPAEIIKPIKSTQTETRRKAAVGAPLPLHREQLCPPGAAPMCPAGLAPELPTWWGAWGGYLGVGGTFRSSDVSVKSRGRAAGEGVPPAATSCC